MLSKPDVLPRWLLFLILPLGGLIAAALMIANGHDRDAASSLHMTNYPSPAPVTFIPPTLQPRPTPTIPPAQEGIMGEPVPPLILTALDGSSVHLSDLWGQVVFLNFWATWCVPCREEMPALQKLQTEQGANGIRVIAITDPTSGQTEEDIRAFVKMYRLTLTVALSSDAALYQQFGVAQIPITYIVDRAGVVRFKHIGALNADDIAAYLDQLAS